jgi:hypothetical protein
MVRAPDKRLRKYDAKMVGDVIKNRIDAQRDGMVEQQQSIQGELSLMESKAKAILESLGVATIYIPQYLNYVRECYRLFKHFSQVSRQNEAQVMFNKWVSRGLTPSTLAKVSVLCGITIPGYA